MDNDDITDYDEYYKDKKYQYIFDKSLNDSGSILVSILCVLKQITHDFESR